MTLRGRIFALFLALAAAPLVLLALLGPRAVERAVDALVAQQVHQLAQRAATALERLRVLQRSDLLLLSGNEETLRLLSGGTTAAQRDTALRYLAEVWSLMRDQYLGAALLDEQGTVVAVLGDSAAAVGGTVQQGVSDERTGQVLGLVRMQPRAGAFLPVAELESRFGARGATYVVEWATGRLLFPFDRGNPAAAPPPQELLDRLDDEPGLIRYAGPDARIAYHLPVAGGASVVATSDPGDFLGPFHRLGRIFVGVLLSVLLVATFAFAVLLSRATRSLRALTDAADAVGRGDFAPALPETRTGDVGRLTAAFRLMAAKIRDMLVRVEASRQMAVLGEFAARLSHELRNPLTAIKLNLQALDRDARADRLTPAAAARPLAIALGEIDRLDAVLRGVLDVARSQALEPRRIALHALLGDVRDLIQPQAERKHVIVRLALHAVSDDVVADPAELKGAVLNLMLNALEAAPSGTTVEAITESAGEPPEIRLRIRDQGPGIPPDLRDSVFRPFFTTKPEGTGLGLSMALRTARDLGGDLTLEDSDDGAAFVLRVPIVAARQGTPVAGAVA